MTNFKRIQNVLGFILLIGATSLTACSKESAGAGDSGSNGNLSGGSWSEVWNSGPTGTGTTNWSGSLSYDESTDTLTLVTTSNSTALEPALWTSTIVKDVPDSGACATALHVSGTYTANGIPFTTNMSICNEFGNIVIRHYHSNAPSTASTNTPLFSRFL